MRIVLDRAKHGNNAQIVSAIIAVLAFLVVVTQVYFISRNFKVAAARQVYMSYSEAALRYPEFVEPDLPKLKNNPSEYIRYKSFVSHMLFAYDEIFTVYDEPEWRKSFEIDVKYHMPYLCGEMVPSDDDSYFYTMRKILKQTRAECPIAKSE
jgi:hypothetical protein